MIRIWTQTVMDHCIHFLDCSARGSHDVNKFDLLCICSCNTIDCRELSNSHSSDNLQTVSIWKTCVGTLPNILTPGLCFTLQYPSAA